MMKYFACFVVVALLNVLSFSSQAEEAENASTAELAEGGSSTAELEDTIEAAPPERLPASGAKKALSAAKSLANTAAKGKSPSRRAKLPNDIVHGLEFRVHHKKIDEMFWVIERNQRYDLVYANSSGSKSSIGISAFDFRRFHRLASELKPQEGSLAKCSDASMQLHVLTPKNPERTVTMCLASKGKDADNLRKLGYSLGAMVR